MAKRKADAWESPRVLKIRKALLKEIEAQLSDGEHPLVVETFERLKSEGQPEYMAKMLIGATLLMELNDMVKDKVPFNEPRYAAALRRLPDLTLD